MNQRAANIGAAISFFAAGIVVGLGFIAAWVKFTATRPDLLDLLDVGRVQFGALHWVELALVPLACLWIWLGGARGPRKWVAVTAVSFVIQAVLIQPPLHTRMVERLAGKTLPDSNLHIAYVVVSLALTVALVGQGFVAISQKND